MATNRPLTDEQRIQLWMKYEDTAMHFNDLIMRLRLQALSGIAVIFALASMATTFASGPITSEQMDMIFGTVIFLIFAWVAIAILDLFYYHTLLLGAVDALLEIEEGTAITLSTRIEQRFGRRSGAAKSGLKERAWPLLFYVAGLIPLVLAACMSKHISREIKTLGAPTAVPTVLDETTP